MFRREIFAELSESVDDFGNGAELDITGGSYPMYNEHQVVDLLILAIWDFWQALETAVYDSWPDLRVLNRVNTTKRLHPVC